MKRWFSTRGPAIVIFLIFSLALEGAVHFSWLPAFLFPPPTEVLQCLWRSRSEFMTAFLQTFECSFLGFFLSIMVGGSLALLFSLSDFIKKAIMPFAVFFQTVPIIAIAPLLVIYFGFGPPTVIASSFIVSVFPVVAGTLLGLESVEIGKINLFKLYRATRWQTLWKLKLPEAYPHIYGALKISLGLSIIGTIAGEFVAGGGLGALIDAARTQQRIDIVFGALLVLSLMGMIGVSLLKMIHHRLQRIRPYGIHIKD